MINLGILCSGLLGYALVEDVQHGWRYVQGFIIVPAVAQVYSRALLALVRLLQNGRHTSPLERVE